MLRSGVLVGVLLCACAPSIGSRCGSDLPPCPTGTLCDSQLNLCARSDGGRVDGGGVDGGNAGGTGDGGFGDSGVEANCEVTCQPWEACLPSADGGVCTELTLSFVSPASGAIFDAGSSMSVVVHATFADGGAFALQQVPLTSTFGTNTTVLADSALAVTLPSTANMYSLTAGWDGGHSASVTIFTQSCIATCQPWETCVATTGGGVCVDPKYIFHWLTPAPNSVFAGGVTATGTLQVTQADGGTPSITSIPLRFGSTLSSLSCSGANCSGIVGPLSSPDGPKLVSAGWDAGPHDDLTLTLDTTGPILSIVLPTDGGPQQRDALLPIILTANEPLGDAGVFLQGAPVSRADNSSCPNFGSVSNARGCYLVDLSQPALNAFTGTFTLSTSGVDPVSNSALGPNAPIPVTRLRWETYLDAGTIIGKVQALAVGPNGDIYAGNYITDTAGALFRVDAQTGATLAASPIGSVQSLAATDSVLYYAANDGTKGGAIGGLSLDTLTQGPLGNPCVGPTNASRTYSGLALVDGGTMLAAVGSINGGSTKLCLYDATNGASTTDGAGTEAAVVPTKVPTATNVLVSGSTASFLRAPSLTSGSFWQPITAITGARTKEAGQQLVLTSEVAGLGQALVPVASDGPFLMCTNQSAIDKQLFLSIGVDNVRSGTLNVNASTGVPSLVSRSEVYVGRGNDLVIFSADALAADATRVIAFATGDFLRTAPILGKPRTSGGEAWGYAVSSDGVLVAFKQGGTPTPWSTSLGSTGVVALPTLDCNRSAPMTKTGVLYVGDSSSHVKAIIVDSPGLLDTPGAWPKYQRTAGNAGNDDTTTFPTNWPACQ